MVSKLWWEGQDLLELSAVLIRIWPDESRFTSFPTQSFIWNVFQSNAYGSQEEMYRSEVTWMGIVSKWRTSTPWNGSSWYSAPVSVHRLARGAVWFRLVHFQISTFTWHSLCFKRWFQGGKNNSILANLRPASHVWSKDNPLTHSVPHYTSVIP